MKKHRRPRRGLVLVLVLVIVPILALGAYSYNHWMRAEAHGAVVHLQLTQARWLAHSGVEHVQAILSDPLNLEPGALNLIDNPDYFARVPVAPNFRSTAGFVSIVAPPLTPDSREIRYGLVNESAKIPLSPRRLLLAGSLDEQRDRLMLLPNMTAEAAESILDWIDQDDQPRPAGAEADYYLSFQNPYSPRNAPPRTVGELLLVRGVTPTLLYGEDVNLDGVLNPNENDGNRSWPPDNQDDVLDRGWYPFLSVNNVASDWNPDGEEKIDLNGADFATQRETCVELFGEDWYNFVTAYKTNKKGKKIRTISELIDAKTTVKQSGGGAPGRRGGGSGSRDVEIESPWTSQNTAEYLDNALSYLTVSKGKRKGVVTGRIDITSAEVETLLQLPGLEEGTAEAIAAAALGRTTIDLSPAWLLTEGIVTLDEFRKIESYVTTQGRVFKLESVGFFSQDAPMARVEAIIDASRSPARVLSRRELLAVGSGYTQEMLMQGAKLVPLEATPR